MRKTGTRRQTRLKVLLIDDDEDEFLLTQDLLADRSYRSDQVEQVGYDLEWVSTYEDALDAFLQEKHDVYLVDYQLGGRDGLELIREASQRGCNPVAILMTGHGSYEVDMEAMRSGATDYLVKGEVTAALLDRSIRYAMERKRAEARLRDSEERLRLALNAAGMGTWDLNFNTQEIVYSAGFESAFGLEEGTFPSRLPDFLELLDETDKQQVLSELDRIISLPNSEDDVEMEFQVRFPEGEQRWLLSRGKLIRNDSSKPGRMMGVLTDITERKRAEDDMRKNAERAQLLATLSQAFAENTLQYPAILSTIVEQIATSFDVACILRLLSGDRLFLHPAAHHHPNPEIKATMKMLLESEHQRAEEGLAGHVYLTARPLLFSSGEETAEEIRNSKSFQEWQKILPIYSALVVPLRAEGRLIGTLGLLEVEPNERFSRADLVFFQDIADRAALAIENATLHAEVQMMAITDALTGFYNRRGFMELGNREVERTRRFGRSLSLIMVDIDNFKEINDSYGHTVGDDVLRIIAERLRTSVRDVDVLCRYGGDEFIILLPETDLNTAVTVAERIRQRLADPMALPGPAVANETQTVTASLGVESADLGLISLTELVQRADAAAYAAKRAGRNRVKHR